MPCHATILFYYKILDKFLQMHQHKDASTSKMCRRQIAQTSNMLQHQRCAYSRQIAQHPSMPPPRYHLVNRKTLIGTRHISHLLDARQLGNPQCHLLDAIIRDHLLDVSPQYHLLDAIFSTDLFNLLMD